jgi:cobalt/nickel transport system permease protein
VSHLHLPDGVVPVWLWAPALLLVLVLLALSNRSATPQTVAYQGALGGLMLAAMAIPLGPLDYHLTLAGPVGILLGAAGAFPVVFVASAILAFLGHGGLTSVGLNTLMLGGAAAVSRGAFFLLVRRLGPAWAMALASAAGQVMAALLWIGIVAATLGLAPRTATLAKAAPRLELLAGLALVLWIVGTLIESVVAFGIGRFLARVHPALLPALAAAPAEEAA